MSGISYKITAYIRHASLTSVVFPECIIFNHPFATVSTTFDMFESALNFQLFIISDLACM